MDNENLQAAGVGAFAFIILFALIGQEFFPHYSISKTLFVVLIIISGIVGIVVKDRFKKKFPK